MIPIVVPIVEAKSKMALILYYNKVNCSFCWGSSCYKNSSYKQVPTTYNVHVVNGHLGNDPLLLTERNILYSIQCTSSQSWRIRTKGQ